MQQNPEMDELEKIIAGKDLNLQRHEASRVKVSVPLLPVQELLAKELEENPQAVQALDPHSLPRSYREHEVVTRHPGKAVFPLALYPRRCPSDSQRWSACGDHPKLGY